MIEVEDDLVTVGSQGSWNLEQTEQMIAIWDEVHAAYGRLFYIGDFSKGIQLDATVRKRLIDWSQNRRFTALAIVVTSLPVRAFAMLVVRGAQLRNPSAPTPFFCSTVTEAHHAIAKARQLHKQATAPS